jgi:hypothetical protein
MRDSDRKIVQKYVKNNPTAPFSQFKKEFPKAQVSDCCYYTYRRKSKGVSVPSTTHRRQKIYYTVFSCPSLIPAPAKKVLKDFVDSLNRSKSSRLEIVESVSTKQIEIRELKVL